jgi:hypothetical protein
MLNASRRHYAKRSLCEFNLEPCLASDEFLAHSCRRSRQTALRGESCYGHVTCLTVVSGRLKVVQG